MNWAEHLPAASQPLATPVAGPAPLSLSDYVSELRHLAPFDPHAMALFGLRTRSVFSGTRPPAPLLLGRRPGADGAAGARIALQSRHLPWELKDARQIDYRGDLDRRDEFIWLCPTSAAEACATGAPQPPQGMLGVYLGALLQSASVDEWAETGYHLVLSVSSTFSFESDSPVFAVHFKAPARGAVSRDPVVATLLELTELLQSAADSPSAPLPASAEACMASGTAYDAVDRWLWVVRTPDLAMLKVEALAEGKAMKPTAAAIENSSQQESAPQAEWEQGTGKRSHSDVGIMKKMTGWLGRHR